MGEPRPGAARPAWVSDELFPFTSRYVDVAGHRVHHVDEGTGPVLLMLHGAPTWSFVYREAILRLRGSFRCIALDYPGLGLSDAAAGYAYRPEEHAAVVTGFLEALDLTQVTLVVHDWGGPIGLAAAQRHPGRFAGLVIGNTWAWPVDDDPHFSRFSRILGGPVGRALVRRTNLMVPLMLPLGHRRRRPSAEEMRHYRAALGTPERRHASALFPHSITASTPFLADVERRLDALRHLPALVLWADRDLAFRTEERERWEAELPLSTTVVLPGVGHFLQSDAPEEFAEAIHSWHARAVAT